jgi:hypothetical protein
MISGLGTDVPMIYTTSVHPHHISPQVEAGLQALNVSSRRPADRAPGIQHYKPAAGHLSLQVDVCSAWIDGRDENDETRVTNSQRVAMNANY